MYVESRWQEFKRSAVAWGGLFVAIAALRLLYVWSQSFYAYIFGDQTNRFYLMVGILAIGVMFYYLRKFSRPTYGTLEIAFAVAWAWAVAEHAGEPSPQLDLISFMGILYLVVSGLESCAIGGSGRKKTKDEWE